MGEYTLEILLGMFVQTVVFSIICFSLWARIQLLEREVLRTRQVLDTWIEDGVRDLVTLLNMFVDHKKEYHTRGGSEDE